MLLLYIPYNSSFSISTAMDLKYELQSLMLGFKVIIETEHKFLK